MGKARREDDKNTVRLKMAQIMALDYGTKRTGIAVTDEEQIIASGLTTVLTDRLMDFLHQYVRRHQVEAFVLGDPKRLDGSPTHTSAAVQQFQEELSAVFGRPVYRVDERFTSKMAVQAIVQSGLKKKQRQNKQLVDEVSATIILQSYLEMNRHAKRQTP